jgi:redox-sensitive bicupin YhaK (pirin superfamily)
MGRAYALKRQRPSTQDTSMPDSIKAILKPHVRDVGSLAVRRVLPAMAARLIGPFIFFDHMGPATLTPGTGLDVRPHPHIGLATVTYLFEGAIMHRDSIGSVQKIVPGDVNWMTAGRGIVHSERTPDEDRGRGLTMHGIQTWVALPLEREDDEPFFEHHAAATLPQIERNGVTLRVIAGTAFGETSPVTTFSGTLYVAAHFAPGSAFALEPEHDERGVYLVEGDLTIDGEPLAIEQMAVLTPGETATLASQAGATVMVLGGEKLAGERFIEWNFVASSRERIAHAKEAWMRQEMGKIPGETEWIPLPERAAR